MAAFFALLFIAAIVTGLLLYKKPVKKAELPDGYQKLLTDHVTFYRSLDVVGKSLFEEKIKEFLGYIRIKGVNTEVDILDKLLVASSGVIPIFGFPEWKYYNLRDILLYPDSFNDADFSTTGKNRNAMGMVGNGAMQMMMILSKASLHRDFDDQSGKENTGIHEFVHLLDKEDGDVDGLPEALLEKKYCIPWLHLMSENIAAIKAGRSDINIYGAKNKEEFFAVAAEYFFVQPEQFQGKHPDLYNLMTKIFRQSFSFIQ